MYNNINSDVMLSLRRAKIIDEPIVRVILQELFRYLGYEYSLGTEREDWNHIDILQTHPKQENIHIDVKRNHSSQWDSENFTFTFINPVGKYFPFDKNGRFAFIDDVDGAIYLVPHLNIEEYIGKLPDKYKYLSKNAKYGNLSKYVLIRKWVIKKLASCIIPADVNRAKLLELTRDEKLFEITNI